MITPDNIVRTICRALRIHDILSKKRIANHMLLDAILCATNNRCAAFRPPKFINIPLQQQHDYQRKQLGIYYDQKSIEEICNIHHNWYMSASRRLLERRCCEAQAMSHIEVRELGTNCILTGDQNHFSHKYRALLGCRI